MGIAKCSKLAEVAFLRAEICWGEVLGRVVPCLVGKKIHGLLTDYVVVS